MIRLDESIRGIWFCSLAPNEKDFLLSLRVLDEGKHQITYRFRYYNSDDPFDEKDEKSWYSGTIVGKSEQEIIDLLHDSMLPAIAKAHNASGFTEILRGERSLDEFVEEFMKQDFVHAKQESLH